MYDLFIANKNYSSWSLRPWVLLRTLAIPFRERLVPFEGETSYDSFRDFSPTGQVPCLTDGDAVIWESLGIAEYLAERHPGVWPADAAARAWARCAACEMHAGFNALRTDCTMNCGVRIRPDAISPRLARDIARIEELWSQGLERFGGPFLAGAEFTAVDAFFAPVAFRVQTYGLQMNPVATAYGERLRALPAMREWYDAALQEPWRDPAHEAEAAAGGTLLQDLRAA